MTTKGFEVGDRVRMDNEVMSMNSTSPRVLSVAVPDDLRARVAAFIVQTGGVKHAAKRLGVAHTTLARIRDAAPVTRPLLAFVDAQLRIRSA